MYDIENPIADDNHTLLSLVVGLTSDELLQQFSELNQILLTAEFYNHIDAVEILAAAMEADEFESTDIVMEVDNLLRESARICLLECGVQYDDEISMDLLIDLTRTILHYDTTEDPQSIIDLIEASDDQHDAFLKILAHQSGRDYDEWVTVIEEVGEGVIDRIENIALNALEMNTTISDTDYEFAKRLEALKSVDDGEFVQSFESLTRAPDINNLYLINVGRLVDKDPETVVKSMYAMACVSRPSFEAAYTTVGLMLDDFCETAMVRHDHEQYRQRLKSTYSNLFGE